MADEQRPSKPPTDVVLVHSPTEDGKGARVLRLRDEQVEAGEVRPLEDGKPVSGEVVRLKPRSENERLCDVEVVMPRKSTTPAQAGRGDLRKGPAQVATDDYRDNWGRIFSSKKIEKLN